MTKVSDSELDAALEAPVDTATEEPVVDEPVVDEPVVDEPVVDEPVVDPEEHKESSRLGRKVAEIDNKFDSLTAQIAALIAAQTPAEPEPDYDMDMPVSRRDIENIIAGNTAKEQKLVADYEEKYVKAMSEMGVGIDDTELTPILNEAHENFNVKHSNNPVQDAQTNFLRAENALLRRGVTTTNPIKGKPNKLATGVNGGVKDTERPQVLPELDEMSKELIADSGMSVEDVQAALTK